MAQRVLPTTLGWGGAAAVIGLVPYFNPPPPLGDPQDDMDSESTHVTGASVKGLDTLLPPVEWYNGPPCTGMAQRVLPTTLG